MIVVLALLIVVPVLYFVVAREQWAVAWSLFLFGLCLAGVVLLTLTLVPSPPLDENWQIVFAYLLFPLALLVSVVGAVALSVLGARRLLDRARQAD
jgi:hypothetical protein